MAFRVAAGQPQVRRAGGAGGPADVDGKSVDELVISATHELLKAADWSANMALVDVVTRDASVGAAMLKALKPRVLHKDPHVSLLGLAALDGLVNNCVSFHPHVANRDFLKELVKSLPKKVRDPQSKSLFRLDSHSDANSMERNDRVLVLLQSWANAFAASVNYPSFRETYQDLLSRGVTFPAPSQDEGAPVFTPPVKPKPVVKPAEPPVRKFADVEARACYESAELLDEMLTASDPSKDLRKHDLIPDLVASMRVAQAKLAGRVTQPNSDAVLNEILVVNDAMGTAIRYYEGLLNGTLTRKSKKAPAPAPKADEKKADVKSPAPAAAAGAAAAGGEAVPSSAKNGQSAGAASTPNKKVPALAPPSSNSRTKGRHGGSPAMAGVAGSPTAGPATAANPPLIALSGVSPPKAGHAAAPAPAPAPAPIAKPADDLSELFFGASIAPAAAPAPAPAPAAAAVANPFGLFAAPAAAPAAAAAPVPVNGGVMNPFAPTPAGAKAQTVLDAFLNPSGRPAAAAAPQPVAAAAPNPFAIAAPQMSAAPPARPQAQAQAQAQPHLQPVLAAKYGGAPAAVAPNPIAVLDDDPFAAFAARDAAPAAAAAAAPAAGVVLNSTLDEENPFDQLARR